ncbi:MAG: DUF1330 domain-containing protein [Cellvibrionales bacterium]
MDSRITFSGPGLTLACVLCFLLGVFVATALPALGVHSSGDPEANGSPPNPAYLIGAATITDFDALPSYRKIAEPLAERYGYEVIASGTANSPEIILLEGTWPAQGLWFIERYESMSALLAFARSDEYREAKQVRKTVADVHFMLAIEGGERGTSKR